MRRTVLLLVFIIVLAGCDISDAVEEANTSLSVATLKASAQESGINPAYVDYQRMIELGVHDAYISETISLAGRQISRLEKEVTNSKAWPIGY